MAKEYKDSTGSERVASAEKMAKEEYSPLKALGNLVKEKLLPKEAKDPVPPTPKAGLKKGGKVKCMARGGGIEVRGKTRGRMV